MAQKIIGIITDFGLQDQYVSSMKGVILSINPNAQIVDITHNIVPHQIKQAGFILWSVYKYFPKDAIFICVVDPGVGSNRSIIAVKIKGMTFFAPDNGLLDFILAENTSAVKLKMIDKLANNYILNKVSSTFHGRDIFAPIAAHVSKGLCIDKISQIVKNEKTISPFIYTRKDRRRFSILHIDRFGNIITNLLAEDYKSISKDVKAIYVGGNLVKRWVRYYEEAPENTPCLILGSNNLVEISVKNKSASQFLNATISTSLKIY